MTITEYFGVDGITDTAQQQHFITKFKELLNKMQGGSLNDPLADIKVKIAKPDLKNTTIVPEIGTYNPMANIEEPPMPPDGLIFVSTNTDSFNNNQLSLNNWRNQNTDFNTRGEGTDSVI